MKSDTSQEIENPTFPDTFAELQTVEGTRKFVLRGKDVEVASLEKFQSQPNRLRAKVQFHNLKSFAAYTQSNQDADHIASRSFVSQEGNFETIFDFGFKTEPGFGDHRAIYNPKVSRQWSAWGNKNNQRQKQAEFADFIDKNMDDVVEPESGVLLDIIRNIEGHTTAQFQAVIRAEIGNSKMVFVEETEIKGGMSGTEKGEMTIPREIKITVPVFNGGMLVTLTVRLKITIESGKPIFVYEMRNHEKAVEVAVDALVNEFKEVSGVDPHRGNVSKFGVE